MNERASSPDPGAFHRPPRSFPPAMPEQPIVIAAPPTRSSRFSGGLLTALLPALGSLGIVAFAFITPNRLFLIVAGVFVAISLASALGMMWAQRRSGRRSQRSARRLYRAHLAERERQLAALAVRQREIDERLYPDPVRLVGLAAHREHLWERRARDLDFLAFRLGRAPVHLSCPVRFELSDDPLIEYDADMLAEAEALIARHRTVDGLSVVAGVGSADVVTVSGDRSAVTALARSLLAQSATFRAPSDLRVLVACSGERADVWEWVKWLPHARSGWRSDRGRSAQAPSLLLARGVPELAELLEEHVQPRLEQLRRIEASGGEGARASIDAPELLVVLDGFHAGGEIARLPLVRELAAHGARLKVRTVCLVHDGAAEPPEAALRILLPAGGPATLERTGPDGIRVSGIAPDAMSPAAAETLARSLAPLRLEEGASGIDLASEVRLVDLPPADPGTLRAPIGLGEDGSELVLDLKQAADDGMGPHGLVVGATGSGKSELLRTIVGSLAASHDPDELAFVFVDFKGGAAFAELAGLPHAAGMITNLQHDLTLVDRMHAALFGEQQRRQTLLREAGNLDDIGAYQAARAARPELAPLPHLLLIVDEFGELLANRPEFIELFLAVGRVGRSLGMHLLLSSQRLEEGRLKGLEGHLRYRICLRTYSAAESKSVLGTADAYLLPPYPGVGYLSVDTDVYLRFKTALVTSPHDDGSKTERVVVSSFHPVAGPAAASVAAANRRPGRSDLDVIVSRAQEAHRGRVGVHQVWLPPLPGRIALPAVIEQPPWWERDAADTAPGPQAAVGLADLPAEQRQEALRLDLGGGAGHLALVGAPQSGKSTFLRTMLVSLMRVHTPDELRVYGLDFGGGLLRALADAPHVGGVSARAEPERVEATVRQVRALLDERELIFRERRIDSMGEARHLRAEGQLSPDAAADVLLVVDNWGGLIAEHEELAEPLAEIAASGLARGIHLVVTAGRWAEIRAAVRDSFGGRLELRLNDPMDSAFGRRVAEQVPAETPGRGITAEGILFQIALPRLDRSSALEGLGDAVGAFASALADRWAGARAPAVRTLPARLDAAALPAPDGSGLPIGVEELTLDTVRLDLAGADGHLLVFGEPESGRTSVLRLLATGLAARPERVAELVVVDFRRGLADLVGLHAPVTHITRMPQLEEAMRRLRETAVARLHEEDSARPEIHVLVDDYDLVAGASPNPLAALGDIVVQARDAGIHVILARASSGAARAAIDPVLTRVIESGAPVLVLSGDPTEGPLVRGVRAEPLPPGRGRLLRRRGRPSLVQLAQVSEPARSVGAEPASPSPSRARVAGPG